MGERREPRMKWMVLDGMFVLDCARENSSEEGRRTHGGASTCVDVRVELPMELSLGVAPSDVDSATWGFGGATGTVVHDQLIT